MVEKSCSFVRSGNTSPFPKNNVSAARTGGVRKTEPTPDLVIVATRAFDVCSISALMEAAHLQGRHSRFLCMHVGCKMLKRDIQNAKALLLIVEGDTEHEEEILAFAASVASLKIGLISRNKTALAPHMDFVRKGHVLHVSDLNTSTACIISSLMT